MPIFLNHSNYILDACTLGLGAVLFQNQDGVDWVIGYASRAISKTEYRYSANKLEFFALKWVMMEQFHEYLLPLW